MIVLSEKYDVLISKYAICDIIRLIFIINAMIVAAEKIFLVLQLIIDAILMSDGNKVTLVFVGLSTCTMFAILGLTQSKEMSQKYLVVAN